MHTKLLIDISQGIIEVEGDSNFVREIYSDFRDNLLKNFKYPAAEPDKNKSASRRDVNESKAKRKSATKKGTKSEPAVKNGIDADNPQLDKNLDTFQLSEFYNQFEPKNHPERILIFAKYLTDKLCIETINSDQIYTCYKVAKEKIPTAFKQNIRNTHGRNYGYIEFNSSSEIKVTINGENHFNSRIKRTKAK